MQSAGIMAIIIPERVLQGLGLRVKNLGLRIEGLGYRVQDLAFRVMRAFHDAEFEVKGPISYR